MRAVVTRAVHQAEELAAPLRQAGFEVILLPMIAIAPPSDPQPLKQAAAHCEEYDWIIFSSTNAVEAFAAELPRPPTKVQIATVGAATREVAERKGFDVTVTPEKYVAEDLVDTMRAGTALEGKRILIPSAAVTRDVIPTELRALGAQVDVVEAYRNVLPPESIAQAPLVFQEPYPDIVLFASSSAVDNLVSLVGVSPLRHSKLISIGPITSATVRKHGLPPFAEARQHTVEGLVDACVMMQINK